MRKYFDVFRFRLKQETKFKYDYLSGIFSFTIHIIVFGLVWDFILHDNTFFGYTKEMLIWYVIVCELVIYASGSNYKEVSYMVKNGDIANLLIKPISIIGYLFSQSMSFVIRFVVNIVAALILGIAMAGTLEITAVQLVFIAISMLLSILLSIIMQISIGLSSFFVEESSTINLIVSKLMLILVFSPIEVFPEPVILMFRMLPTTYIVYAPAKIVVNYMFEDALSLIGMQILAIIVCSFFMLFEYKEGVKKINANGG